MTLFEHSFLLGQSVYPALYRKVRHILKTDIRCRNGNGEISLLDIGGRKSHYTIGLAAKITISDLPRTTPIQIQLHLGMNQELTEQLRKRRSNVQSVVYDDMTRTKFTENSFDLIVAVEVLEHVEEDEIFIQNVHRILKNGGVFIMTTPNGDFVPNRFPDHKRHYSKVQLHALLHKYFDSVETWGDVRSGRFHHWGLKAWSIRNPIRTIKSMMGNALNYYQPVQSQRQEYKTQHLFAKCHKK